MSISSFRSSVPYALLTVLFSLIFVTIIWLFFQGVVNTIVCRLTVNTFMRVMYTSFSLFVMALVGGRICALLVYVLYHRHKKIV